MGQWSGFDYLWVSVMYQAGLFKETESGQASRLAIQVGIDVLVLSLKFIEQVSSLQTGRILCYSLEAEFLFLLETLILKAFNSLDETYGR